MYLCRGLSKLQPKNLIVNFIDINVVLLTLFYKMCLRYIEAGNDGGVKNGFFEIKNVGKAVR